MTRIDWQLVSIPISIILFGYILLQWKGEGWDSIAMFWWCWIFSIIVSIGYVGKVWIEAGLLKDIKPEPKEVKPEPEPRKIDNLNMVYSQTVPQVKFNKVARFATTLLAMQAHGNVDLREPTWKTHFGSRESYVQVRTRFENAGAFVRKTTATNSPFIVNDKGGWYVVERVAAGDETVLN